MPPTETSKSQATNHTSCHASHRYHQITGNNSYILPCLTQMPTNHRQQIVHLAMPHTDTSKSSVKRKCSRGYDLLRALGPASCDIPHYPASKSQTTNRVSFHASPQANHRQQIIHLVMSRTDTTKSKATNLYILPCLTQMPKNQRQQIVHLAMSHTDTGKSNVKRKSSRGYDLLRALGSASCDITHEAGDTSCDITHEPQARFVAILTVCWKSPSNNMCVTVSLPRRPYN